MFARSYRSRFMTEAFPPSGSSTQPRARERKFTRDLRQFFPLYCGRESESTSSRRRRIRIIFASRSRDCVCRSERSSILACPLSAAVEIAYAQALAVEVYGCCAAIVHAARGLPR
jgi:hypothetical protein